MPVPSPSDFERIAAEFEEQWEFLNVMGKFTFHSRGAFDNFLGKEDVLPQKLT